MNISALNSRAKHFHVYDKVNVEIPATSQFGTVYRIARSVNTETEAGHTVKGGGMGRIDGESDLVQ